MSDGCEFFADALIELDAGTLEPERADRVEAHLASCADCRADLDVIRAVRGARAPIPEGLEERLVKAVTAGAGGESEGEASANPGLDAIPPRGGVVPRRAPGLRPWALPVAAAAALVLWFGANEILDSPAFDATADVELAGEWDPYGALPASDGVVAGEVVLSELSVEELETLLEEMR